MKVKKIMTTQVKSCQPDSSLTAAAKQMRETNCGILPVMNAERKIVGMITDRDICLALDEGKQLIKVSEVMSGKVHLCSPGDDVEAALEIMRANRVRRLPVINKQGVLKGIFSIDDALPHMGKVGGKKNGKISYKQIKQVYQAICKPQVSELPKTKAMAAV